MKNRLPKWAKKFIAGADPKKRRTLRVLFKVAIDNGFPIEALGQAAEQLFGEPDPAKLTVPQLRGFVQRISTRLGDKPGLMRGGAAV